MGCMQVKEARTPEEEAQILGPPSKVMDASEHVQVCLNLFVSMLQCEFERE